MLTPRTTSPRILLGAILAVTACGVTPDQRLVGEWSVDVPASTVPAVEIPGGKERVSDFISGLRLKLLSDHTFVLSVGAGLVGTWSYAPGVLTLTPTKSEKRKRTVEPVKVQISADEANLTIDQPTPFGEAKVKFRKSG